MYDFVLKNSEKQIKHRGRSQPVIQNKPQNYGDGINILYLNLSQRGKTNLLFPRAEKLNNYTPLSDRRSESMPNVFWKTGETFCKQNSIAHTTKIYPGIGMQYIYSDKGRSLSPNRGYDNDNLNRIGSFQQVYNVRCDNSPAKNEDKSKGKNAIQKNLSSGFFVIPNNVVISNSQATLQIIDDFTGCGNGTLSEGKNNTSRSRSKPHFEKLKAKLEGDFLHFLHKHRFSSILLGNQKYEGKPGNFYLKMKKLEEEEKIRLEEYNMKKNYLKVSNSKGDFADNPSNCRTNLAIQAFKSKSQIITGGEMIQEANKKGSGKKQNRLNGSPTKGKDNDQRTHTGQVKTGKLNRKTTEGNIRANVMCKTSSMKNIVTNFKTAKNNFEKNILGHSIKTLVTHNYATNDLTPIPRKKYRENKIAEHVYSQAERAAVLIRRMEYSENMNSIQPNTSQDTNTILHRLLIEAKSKIIQRWWRMKYKKILIKQIQATAIQKTFRGYLSRMACKATLRGIKLIFPFLSTVYYVIEKRMIRNSFRKMKRRLRRNDKMESFYFLQWQKTSRLKQSMLRSSILLLSMVFRDTCWTWVIMALSYSKSRKIRKQKLLKLWNKKNLLIKKQFLGKLRRACYSKHSFLLDCKFKISLGFIYLKNFYLKSILKEFTFGYSLKNLKKLFLIAKVKKKLKINFLIINHLFKEHFRIVFYRWRTFARKAKQKEEAQIRKLLTSLKTVRKFLAGILKSKFEKYFWITKMGKAVEVNKKSMAPAEHEFVNSNNINANTNPNATIKEELIDAIAPDKPVLLPLQCNYKFNRCARHIQTYYRSKRHKVIKNRIEQILKVYYLQRDLDRKKIIDYFFSRWLRCIYVIKIEEAVEVITRFIYTKAMKRRLKVFLRKLIKKYYMKNILLVLETMKKKKNLLQ